VSESPSAPASGGLWSRRVLLVSLALNLFFVGACAALAWRHYLPREHGGAWTPGVRIERMAAALPAGDADVLHAEFRAQAEKTEAAHGAFRTAQARMRSALRAEPFDPAALRAAMADTRAARAKLDETLQDVVAAASARMTPDGRHRLADWTPYRRNGNDKRR
jgi:uncharacterized membrane protein